MTDTLILWARQGGRPGVREWRRPGAAVVACPELSRKDRIAVWGEPGAVHELLAEALAEVGPDYRPFGDEALIAELARRDPGLEVAGRFGWMETTTPPGSSHRGRWLESDAGVAELLAQAFPESYARPGIPGVRRWAGIHRDGELLAVAAEAWTAPEVGFVAGVATRPDVRGRGLAAALCGFVTAELLRAYGRVALMVDHWNAGALRTYERLGFTLRPIAAATVRS